MKQKELIALLALLGAAFASEMVAIRDGVIYVRKRAQSKAVNGISEGPIWVSPQRPGKEFNRTLDGSFVTYT